MVWPMSAERPEQLCPPEVIDSIFYMERLMRRPEYNHASVPHAAGN